MVLQVSIVDLAVAESTLVMLSPNALNDEIESMLLNGKDVISAALWPVRAIVRKRGTHMKSESIQTVGVPTTWL